ncbi:class I SAM-dependent methyltransferase [Rhodovibrionaceae bacterium A322]
MQQLHGQDIWAESFQPTAQASGGQAKPVLGRSDSQEKRRRLENDEVQAILKDSAGEDIQGWNGLHSQLVRLAGKPRVRLILDVGVWKGQSTVTLAKTLQYAGVDGCVISIDTFLGSVEHWLGEAAGLFGRKSGRPDLYNQFLSNIHKAGVSDLVVPFPLSSEEAAKVLGHLRLQADLIHIDAAHDYESVQRDIRTYWDLVRPGGFLVGDDYADQWPGVVQAVDDFVEEQQLSLRLSSPKWAVKKARQPKPKP